MLGRGKISLGMGTTPLESDHRAFHRHRYFTQRKAKRQVGDPHTVSGTDLFEFDPFLRLVTYSLDHFPPSDPTPLAAMSYLRPAKVPAKAAPIGIARLLEVYDDYPLVVQERDTAQDTLAQNEEELIEARRQRNEIEMELEKVRETAKSDAETARVEKAQAEKDVEERVRGEGDKKYSDMEKEKNKRISELELKLRNMTSERDSLRTERQGWRTRMSEWLENRDKLDEERRKAVEAETQREVERAALDVKMRDLVKGIVEIVNKPATTTTNNSLKPSSASIKPGSSASLKPSSASLRTTTTSSIAPSSSRSSIAPSIASTVKGEHR